MTATELSVLLALYAHAPRVQDQRFFLARLGKMGLVTKTLRGSRLTAAGRELVEELTDLAAQRVSLFCQLRASLELAKEKRHEIP